MKGQVIMRFQISAAASLVFGAVAFHGSTAQSDTAPASGVQAFATSNEVFSEPSSTNALNSTMRELQTSNFTSNTTDKNSDPNQLDNPEVGATIITLTNSTDNVTTAQSNFTSDTPSSLPTALPSAAPSSYPTITSNAIYYDFPKLKWSTTLEGTGFFGAEEAKLATGNAVLSSPDGAFVYVTLDNGALRVLSAHDGRTRWTHTPELLASGWSVTCNSGVYFGEMKNGQQYVVYAVVDVPPDTGKEDYSS
jgi:hypothetical protein